ncbi:hypothetical protein GOP47_0019783 [Adiantum capillus-veneris]|uniref:Histone-lysine N-methyltransferase n=1 Tax=Adiantum capillus-veneris TaxID=13818 RepID=A0A9D4UCP2_ADICA|nr:hypothetical protein GOP47_0019783 [Adiantum capillus-veneris]
MSPQTEKLHSTCNQAEGKGKDDLYQQGTICSRFQIKMPLSPSLFSPGTLPDHEEAIEASTLLSSGVGPQRKTPLHARKFFYPKFKRRACGMLTSESLQFSNKEDEKTENCLQPACISETLPNVAVIKEFVQLMNSRTKVHNIPHEVSLRDITNCESPASLFPHGNEKDFFPKSCTETPYPINRNPAFRFLESPCRDNFPVLSFVSLEEQQHKYIASPSCSVPYSEKDIKSHKPNSVPCSDTGNLLINSSKLTELQFPGDEQEKENHPPALKSNSQTVLVYRSLKKTKNRRKLRPEQILSLKQASVAGCTGILKTRCCARLDMVQKNRCVRSGPVLRSSQNAQTQGEKIIKERPLSTYGSKKFIVKALLEKYLWNRRLKYGTPSRREVCLPFLNGEAGRRVECFSCKAYVATADLTSCSHKDCNRSYHVTCGQSLEDFYFRKNGDAVCPQHVCMVCKGYNKTKVFRCERCTVAAHKKCFAFPENVIYLKSKPDFFICWRHPQDWRLQSESCCSTRYRWQIQRKFSNGYPCPMLKLNSASGVSSLMKFQGMGLSLPRLFRFGGKRDNFDDGVGCTCKSSCRDNCECRAQSMSCSRSCTCNEKCGNKPFRKEKRIKLVKTRECGWGVQITEAVVQGEFIIEYVGEVINEAMCEERLWTLKERGDHNFYMCEIGKDFIIDATYKGNAARFVNHSCDPNCNLEKWRVDGEIRVGIFAIRDIKDGEALTYDYRFVQFGPTVKCRCGASNCRGNLGESYQHKKTKQHLSSTVKIPAWGEKHRRSLRLWPQNSLLHSDPTIFILQGEFRMVVQSVC